MRNLSYALLMGVLVGLVALMGRPDPAYAQSDKWAKSVKGQVIFAGANVPQPQQLNVTKDQEHCLGKGPIVSEEWVINPSNKGIKNVFVWITAAGFAKPPIHPSLA